MKKEIPYNPLDKSNLGVSVADALIKRFNVALEDVEQFIGAGIYAIYYTGDFTPYRRLVTKGIPIYVGKAVPPGARKGNFGLNIEDFQCRYLAVDDIWIPLGEALLIANFSPIWNKIIDGFGNHDPGKGRYQQLRSRWDTLHPGRPWAYKCQERAETKEQIVSEIIAYLESI